MLIYNGVPVCFFQDDGFKLLSGTLLEVLESPLGRDVIREMLLKRAIEKKEKLKNKLSGALIFIKFDWVTRLLTYFLCILAQYFNFDYGLTTKRLALINTEANHTSLNLKNLLFSILREYKINIHKILACVVDKAENLYYG